MKVDSIFKMIKDLYGNSSDLCMRIITTNSKNIGIVFLGTTSSSKIISENIIKAISYIDSKTNMFSNIYKNLKNSIFNAQLKTTKNLDEIPYYLSSGFTIIIVDEHDEIMVMETRADLDRGVNEATNEPVLRGPKDSFTENHSKNLGLIRKRIKNNNLWVDDVIIGKRTKTKVSIVYLKDIIKKEDVEKIKNKLKCVNIDGLLDSGALKAYLTDQKSSFPQILSTERPDLSCLSILNGKIIILVENSPYALILPNVITDFIHTSEDYFENSINISFTRILKSIALFITLFTPAIYIAITTFDQTVIPDKLLISLAVQREGVPFPTAFEVLLLMMIFEILRESDIRLPANMGASMSIVGALVLGEAAVNAGIVSPIAVIVVAITSICSLIFTDVDFINGIRTWRLIFMLAATFLGLIGLVSATFCFILKLSSLESLSISYLSPFSPFNFYDVKNSILKKHTDKKRPKYLNLNDYNKGGKYEK